MLKTKDSDLFYLMFQESSEGMMITDSEAHIIDVNDSFTQITGYSREEVLGKNPNFLHSGKQTQTFYKKFWQAITEEGRWEGEVWNRSKAGEIYPEWLSVSVISTHQHVKSDYYIGRFYDITHRKQQEKQLKSYAFKDPLTGLLNRRGCMNKFEFILEQLDENKLGAVFFMDLDYFKNINDQYGHRIGDKVLTITAKRLVAAVRKQDIVARLGGDEFIVVLGHLKNRSDCLALASKLFKKITHPIVIEGDQYQVGVSIGIQLFSQGETSADLLAKADRAMYFSKENGRNRITFSDEIE
ncbi:MAG: diguanylate cyclase [Gammaproteobacteria bacterium]|nr:diguanylate cyclase [Gammaproteobacteria bacterium]